MSYVHAPALQSALYDRLASDAALAALVGGHVYDMAPEGAARPPVYVALGPEDVADASDSGGAAAVFTFVVSVVGTDTGFATVKQAAARVCAALVGAALEVPGGRVTGVRFRKARARLGDPDQRVVELTFRTRVEEPAAA